MVILTQRTPFFEEQQDNHWEHNQPQQLITGGPSLALGNEPWAREFQTGQFHHNSLAETFPPAMEAVFVNRNDWVDSFNRAQHPIDIDRATAASFQHAFKQAQESGQWTEEFAGSGDLWAQEFAKVRVSEDMQLLDADTTADALSQTAARLLDAVGSTSNEKFKNSQFFSLMRQFKDKEAAIEGEKVVQQIAPVEKSPLEWANEFAGTKIKPAAWEEQFNSMQLNNLAGGAQSERWVKEFTENANLHTNPLIDSNQSWSQEFGQTNNGAWSEEFRQRSFEASDSMQGTTMPPQSDWAEKFKEKMSLLPQDEVVRFS